MNFSEAIAGAVDTAAYSAVIEPVGPIFTAHSEGAVPPSEGMERQPVERQSGPAPTQVFQLNQVPTTLNTQLYADARSTSNPNGSLTSLFALRQLVDPIPTINPTYSPSSMSTEGIYQLLVNGANVAGDSPFAQEVIANAMRNLQANQFADMDGTSGTWGPVYAVPEDWYTNDISRFKSLKADMSSEGSADGPFELLGGEDELEWRLGKSTAGGLSPNTQLQSLEMKYMFVGFRRPWFNELLFRTSGWYLSGQPAGFCSSGNTSDNNGVLPLVPTGMLIGRNIKITADWSDSDAAVLADAASKDTSASLGPFVISDPGGDDTTVQIIGWFSNPVPLSPTVDGTITK